MITHDEALRLMEDLDRGTNLFGPLSESVRARLFAVVEDPGQENWRDARGIILTRSPWTTLWQALLQHTDFDVAAGPSYGGDTQEPDWPKLPTREQLITTLRAVLAP